jgi:hypothetical protein
LPRTPTEKGNAIIISHSWINNGNISPADNYRLQFHIINKNKVVSDTTIEPSVQTSEWLPGKEIHLVTDIHIDLNLDEVYFLAVRMYDKSGKEIRLNLSTPRSKGCHQIAKFFVRRNVHSDLVLHLAKP